MKPRTRKLFLHRETLRHLDPRLLAGVAGGGYLSQFTDCELCDPDPPDDPQPLSNPCTR